MPYTEEDGGRLNNFALEPRIYKAKPPTTAEKRNYLIIGVMGLLLVVGLIVIAAVLS